MSNPELDNRLIDERLEEIKDKDTEALKGVLDTILEEDIELRNRIACAIHRTWNLDWNNPASIKEATSVFDLIQCKVTGQAELQAARDIKDGK